MSYPYIYQVLLVVGLYVVVVVGVVMESVVVAGVTAFFVLSVMHNDV